MKRLTTIHSAMKRLTTISAALLLTLAMQAQKIDFNNSQNRTEDGYASWVVGIEKGSFNQTIDGITITVARAEGSAGTAIMGEWWKDGVNKYSKLTSDGITVSGKDGDDKFTLRSGTCGIQLTISGLSSGEHSLLAYHNNPAGFNGAPLKVLVNGTTVVENIQQTNRAQSPSASSMSYVKFTAKAGQDVKVVYQTVPDPSVNYEEGYNTTSLYINALVFDQPNPATTASDPTPAHQDMHYDGGTQLSWTAATSAVKHHIYIGSSPSSLSLYTTTTNPYVSVSSTSYDTQYWRVDEEDGDGNVYQGDVWSFRRARLAFPSAEGYGRYAIGGRGGTVYHVTSLADDLTPGTFRYGLTQVSGPRTIVFDVAGVITLNSRLTCSDPYVTIAGQTAPGRGIMFRGNPLGFSDDNIIRFLRMRLGYKPKSDTSGRDGMGINGDYTIMDHCSIGWTIDEAFSSRNCKNITLQRTLISEALNIADHPNYSSGTKHGYAATIGGNTGSYHHNLLAHNEGRNWSMAGGLDGSGAYDGHHDIFNNVCYNWGGRATDGGTHEGNFVSNYYKMGPSTTQKILLKAQLEGTGSGTQSYYVNGNIRQNRDGSLTDDAEDDTYTYVASGGQQVTWTVFVSAPFFDSHAGIEDASAAFQNVLSDVGCNQPALDNHDQRMVIETLNGTTSTVGSKSGLQGLIDRETDSEGFDGLNIISDSRPAGFDTDQDGIPDWYEQARGWSTTFANNNDVAGYDGYTNLEEYLNWLAEPHFFIKTGESISIPLSTYFAGYPTMNVSLPSHVYNGTGWEYADGKLLVESTIPQLFTIDVTVSDPTSGASLMRTFNFYCADVLPQTEASGIANTSHSPFTTNIEYYDLQGRRINEGTFNLPLSTFNFQPSARLRRLAQPRTFIEVRHMSDGTIQTRKVIR